MNDAIFIGSDICFYNSCDLLNKPLSVTEGIREECRKCSQLFGIGFGVCTEHVYKGTIVRVLNDMYYTYYIVRAESTLYLVKESCTHLDGYAPGTSLSLIVNMGLVYGNYTEFFERAEIEPKVVNIPNSYRYNETLKEAAPDHRLYVLWSGYGYNNEDEKMLVVYQPQTKFLFIVSEMGVTEPLHNQIKNHELMEFMIYSNYANKFLQAPPDVDIEQLHLFEWCSNENGEMLIRLDKIQCIKINDYKEPGIGDRTLELTMVSGATLKNVNSPNHNIIDKWSKLLGKTRVINVAEYWFDMYRVQIISRLSKNDKSIIPNVYVSITLVSAVSIKLISSLDWYDAIKAEWQTTITNIYKKD